MKGISQSTRYGVRITVIGLGFVGLTTALGFAEMGYEVCGIEKDTARRKMIAGGSLPFYEPGLDQALMRHIGNGFTVSGDYTSVARSEYIFLCVGTPCNEEGTAELSYIYGALDSCVDVLTDDVSCAGLLPTNGGASASTTAPPIFILKSTVPPSTTSEGGTGIFGR